jgi:hypothetical protein
MKLIQITGTQGGDTVLMVVPDEHAASDVLEVIEDLDGAVDLRGPAVREVELKLPEDLAVNLFSVFVQVN